MSSAAVVATLSLLNAAPLSLDDALALAAKRNAELEVARAETQLAAADFSQSHSGVLPRLDLSGNGDYQYAQATKTGVSQGIATGGDWVWSYEVALNWTFFDGLASWNFISSTRTKAAAADRQLDESVLRVAFEVTRRYYELVKQQRALQVRHEAASLSAELVDRADSLFSAGRGTKADTYNARVNLGNDQLAVQAQRTALARARADLAVVLGLASDAGLEVLTPPAVADPSVLSLAEPPALGELIEMALKGRPLLAAGKLSAESADFDIARAQGAYWPTLALQGAFTQQSPGYVGQANFNPYQYLATGGVTLTYNLYAGGETRASVQRAEAQARRARALVEQERETVSAEVTLAREAVVALAASVGTAQSILGSAEKALQFARDKLEAGIGSQLEVRDATVKLSQAKLAWINSVVDLVVARADLNRAVGGSL